MTRNKSTCFTFKGRNKTFIKASILKKAPKGEYKNDIIELEIKSQSDHFTKVMTPYEAIIIASALNIAVIDYEKNNKRGLLK